MPTAFACLRFRGTPGWIIEGARAIATKCPAITMEVGYSNQETGVITLRAEGSYFIERAVRRLLADPVCSRHFWITREYN